MRIHNVALKRAKKAIRKIVADSEHTPIFFDQNFAMIDQRGLFFSKTNPDDPTSLGFLRNKRKYLSFLIEIIREYPKIVTVDGVISEAEAFIEINSNRVNRRNLAYNTCIRDALMSGAHSNERNHQVAVSEITEMRRYLECLVRIHDFLLPRTLEYRSGNSALKDIVDKMTGAARDVELAGPRPEENDRISETDINLMAAAFYETLVKGNVPLVLSVDKHTVDLRDHALPYFSESEQELLKVGVRLYRDLDSSLFPSSLCKSS